MIGTCEKTFTLEVAPAAIPTELFGKVGIGHGLADPQGGASHIATHGTYNMLLALFFSHNVTGFALLSNVVADFVHAMTLAGHAQALVDGVYLCADAYWIATSGYDNCQCDFSLNTDWIEFVVPILSGTSASVTANGSGNTTPAHLTPVAAPLIISLIGISGFQDVTGLQGGTTHYESAGNLQSAATAYSPSLFIPGGTDFSVPFFAAPKPWIALSVSVT